ncbi:MAG: YhcH/YjgK/YiaL family protein [Gammaproteobacteria bacterium]
MILAPLADADRYRALHPLFARAFDFLRATDLATLPPGRHVIDGEVLFVIIEDRPGRTREAAKLECHRRYIDIQFVFEGVDEMGWKALSECRQLATDYDAARDISFFDDAPDTWIATPAGSFCVFFPDDAHAPLVSAGRIRKAVVKVAVAAG